MFFAIITALLFGVTPVFAARSGRLLGPTLANLARLLIAALVLGLWSAYFHIIPYGSAAQWFILSGIVGLGIGGVSMFHSLTKLGPNLSNLTVQCGSVLAASGVEFLWLGTRLTLPQSLSIALAVVGIAIGLMPRCLPELRPTAWIQGIPWAVLSALAQGCGAVLSRKAFMVARLDAQTIDAAGAGFERVLGGILIALLAVAISQMLISTRRAGSSPVLTPFARAWPWVLANSFTGPILGVTCFQVALRSHPAGIVQAVVAIAPLLTIPMAAWIDGERPRRLYYLGVSLAVLAIATLWLLKAS